ncbi:propanediol diffusion facilitator [Klebsiella pneumoniae subsp. pneumoniae]|nr:propanediol diffusion facilitator [Klebsiella pneumoniae subsp. pneumoniae]
MNGSLRAQCIAEFLGTGLFLFFGICCLSALKLDRRQPGAVGDLYYLGTGYFSGGVPDGRHFGGDI